ncbi:MAG: ybaK/ebsC protein [Acidobacteria bacterium]|jgi:Cys-tRNA(Pro) deacylase|nr:ybaK/ebsC protein [Acidobacteriota bacterium]
MAATSAIRVLRQQGVSFTEHEYRYEEHGGTFTASRELGVDEHSVLKTLVMEDEARRPLLVLMHGDREVSTKQLARQTGRKAVHPCDPAAAQRHTGYSVGGISPFGTLRKLPVFVERSALGLEAIYVNGGRRGLLVRLAPSDLGRVLGAVPVDVSIEPAR